MCTFGLEGLKSNPIDSIGMEELKSDIEQKRSFIVSKIKQRDDDLKSLDQLYEAVKNKIYDVSE